MTGDIRPDIDGSLVVNRENSSFPVFDPTVFGIYQPIPFHDARTKELRETLLSDDRGGRALQFTLDHDHRRPLEESRLSMVEDPEYFLLALAQEVSLLLKARATFKREEYDYEYRNLYLERLTNLARTVREAHLGNIDKNARLASLHAHLNAIGSYLDEMVSFEFFPSLSAVVRRVGENITQLRGLNRFDTDALTGRFARLIETEHLLPADRLQPGDYTLYAGPIGVWSLMQKVFSDPITQEEVFSLASANGFSEDAGKMKSHQANLSRYAQTCSMAFLCEEIIGNLLERGGRLTKQQNELKELITRRVGETPDLFRARLLVDNRAAFNTVAANLSVLVERNNPLVNLTAAEKNDWTIWAVEDRPEEESVRTILRLKGLEGDNRARNDPAGWILKRFDALDYPASAWYAVMVNLPGVIDGGELRLASSDKLAAAKALPGIEFQLMLRQLAPFVEAHRQIFLGHNRRWESAQMEDLLGKIHAETIKRVRSVSR